MKKDHLEDKLEKYYNNIKNPKKIIGQWAIVDEVLLSKLNKIKLDNINNLYSNSNETIIVAESKKYFITIKHNYMFIAIKVISTEYDSLIQDWSLVGVNKNYLYGKKLETKATNKEVISLLGFKLSKKAITDFEYFESFKVL